MNAALNLRVPQAMELVRRRYQGLLEITIRIRDRSSAFSGENISENSGHHDILDLC